MSHPKANRVLEALAAVIDSLKGARVSYMMIGAWALSVWGKPKRKRKRRAGRFCWVIAPEDLILQKLKVGRPRDFEDALSVLERSRKMLDFEYLKHWSGRLGLAAELDYVLGE